MSGALIGKVGSVFASTASQHGGQETTITSFHTTLLHQGMIIVGLLYSFAGLTNMDEITGGSPYGVSTLANADGSRQPSANELDGARYQGKHVAQITAKLTHNHLKRRLSTPEFLRLQSAQAGRRGLYRLSACSARRG